MNRRTLQVALALVLGMFCVASTALATVPYPIIFVHGILGDQTTWEDAIPWFEGKLENPNNNVETLVFHVCLNHDASNRTSWFSHEENGGGDVRTLGWTTMNSDEILSHGSLEPAGYDGVKLFVLNLNDDVIDDLTIDNESADDDHHHSNSAAIYKQGFALGLMIKHVLAMTDAEKVVLVGHSMGGLAIREYLQRLEGGDRIWWVDPEDSESGHRVAKVLTVGTPHLGYNDIIEGRSLAARDDGGIWEGLFNGSFEARRDMKTTFDREIAYETYQTVPGVYLYGGEENFYLTHDNFGNIVSEFDNANINCNLVEGNEYEYDAIVGINETDGVDEENIPLPGTTFNANMRLPDNIEYVWGKYQRDEDHPDDKVVEFEKQWLYDGDVPTPETAKYFNALGKHSAALFGDMIHETGDLANILRGIDEPDESNLCFSIHEGAWVTGFTTELTEGDQRDVDLDRFKFVADISGRAQVALEMELLQVQNWTLWVEDQNNQMIGEAIDAGNNPENGFLGWNVEAGATYFVAFSATPTEESYQTPYRFMVTTEVEEQQQADNIELVNSIEYDGHILDVVVENARAYVRTAHNGLIILDVHDPENVSELAVYNLWGENRFNGNIAIKGNYLYLAHYSAGLVVVDISDPTHPQQVAVVYGNGNYVFNVAVKGDYAYIADHGYGLTVFDISDPTNPGRVGEIQLEPHGGHINIREDVAFYYSGPNYAIDISNPEGLGVRSQLRVHDGSAASHFLFQNYLFEPHNDAPRGIQLLDVSDPDHIQSLGLEDFPVIGDQEIVQSSFIAIDETHFIGAGSGILLYDAADMNDRQIVGSYLGRDGGGQLAFSNGYLYVPSTNSLDIYRIDQEVDQPVDNDHVLHVPGEYQTIQAAIDASSDGDEVLVAAAGGDGANGEYLENLTIENRNISIIGDENAPENVVIDGQDQGSVVTIRGSSTDNFSLSGFTIQNGQSNWGPGVYVTNEAHGVLSNLWIRENYAVGNPGQSGAGVLVQGASTVTISEVLIEGNNAEYYGGAILAHQRSTLILADVIVRYNQADTGGGIYVNDVESAVFTRVSIYGNHARERAGGFIAESCSSTLINCIIVSNTAEWEAGGFREHGSGVATFINTIIWGNQHSQIHCSGDQANEVNLNYCDIQGSEEGVVNQNGSSINFVEGNIDDDPLFINANEGNFHLQANSPCINTGNPDHQYDDPDGTRVDMGAFYYHHEPNPEEHVIAYWPADEQDGNTLEDISGNQLHATLAAQASFYEQGHSNWCLSLGNGQSTQTGAAVNDREVLDISEALSLEFWFYPTAYPGATTALIGKFGNAQNTDWCYSVLWGRESNGLAFWIEDQSGEEHVIDHDFEDINLNAWHHFLATYDGESMLLYVDGDLKGQLNEQFMIGNSDSPLYIGWNASGGFMDEIKLVNEAISPDGQQDHILTVGEHGEYQTIQAAIDASSDGDVVRVVAGTYNENISFNGKNISVIGDPAHPENVIINGNQQSSVVSITPFVHGGEISGFTITNGGGRPIGGTRVGGGIFIGNDSGPANGDGNQYASLKHLRIFGNQATYGGGIATYGSGNVYANLSDVEIYNNVATSYGGGIHFRPDLQGHQATPSHLERVIIRNNTAQADRGGGIHSQQSPLFVMDQVSITDNNSGSGIYSDAGDENTTWTITNTILWNNNGGSIHQGNSTMAITYSDIQGSFEGEGNIDDDPLFVNADEGNFHLQANSPCINTGNPDHKYDDPDGTRADMGAYYYEPRPEALVAYYPFDGNADDNSLNNLNGTVHGATLTEDRFQNANSAYHFDGSSYVTVEDDAVLDFGNGADFTFSLWFKTANGGVFFSKYDERVPGGSYGGVMRDGSHVFWGLRDRDGFYEVSDVETNVHDDAWHCIAGRREGTIWSVWLDGELEQSIDAHHNSAVDNNEPLVIGAVNDTRQNGFADYFVGDIDEVRIFNCALTAEEIAALAGFYEPPAPVISVSPPALAFEEVDIDLPATLPFTITNEGNADLIVTSISVEGTRFTTDFAEQFTLAPDDTRQVVVTFHPLEEREYAGTVIVESNDTVHPRVTVTLTGEGVPRPVPTHYVGFTVTDENHSLLVTAATFRGEEIPAGWEIGVFTPGNLLAGSALWVGNRVGLAAWGDDLDTPNEIDGFREGEAFQFRFWDNQVGVEWLVEPTFTSDTSTWVADGFSTLTLVEDRHYSNVTVTDVRHQLRVTEATFEDHSIANLWEIGVFTPASVLAGSEFWLGDECVISAWGDDAGTETVEGFSPDETFYFRFWDKEGAREWHAEATFSEGSSTWSADGYSVLSLNYIPSRDIIVSFTRGWNMISINVRPTRELWIGDQGPDIRLMTERLKVEGSDAHHIILMKDGRGRFYTPAYNYSNIPFWNLADGYQVKVDAAVQATWSGVPIAYNSDIPLARGWNLIAYFPIYRLSASAPEFTVLSPVINHVLIAKDGLGRFMAPRHNYSNMLPWQESQGYQIKVDEALTLNYPAQPQQGAGPANESKNEPIDGRWKEPASTGENMSLLVTQFRGLKVSNGDQVGAFSKSGALVGVGEVNDGRCGLALWGDEQSTVAVDGLVAGDPVVLKLWRASTDSEVGLDASVEVTYEADGFTVAAVNEEDIIPENCFLSGAYPNPFNGVTKLTFGLTTASAVRIAVYNSLGQVQATLLNERREAGNHGVEWNSVNAPTGVYVVKMISDNFTTSTKVVLVK